MDNELKSFLEANKNKKIVAVQGLGFVGAVMSIVVANSEADEYAVVGVDLPHRRPVIDALNEGEFPIQSSDEKVYEYYTNARERNSFWATDDVEVFALADIVIVDINLDVAKESGADKTLEGYAVDMSGFKKAMASIASRCKPDVLVLVETTVPPGTCSKIVKPIFEEHFDQRQLEHTFKIGHSYERVMPGPGYVDSIKNFYRVFAGINEESADATEAFLKTVISTEDYPLTKLKNTNATEMSKVLENSFRAMNIAFIQEWTEFAEAAGVDLYEVVSAIRMRPTHKNIMRPGLGVGGYCLTKDPLLASWSSQELFGSVQLTQSESAVKINDRMPLHTFQKISERFNNKLEGLEVLILGVSYLQNVGDTRYTPVELLYDKLIAAGASITLHDPYVDYWEEKDLSVQTEAIPDGQFDCLVLGTPHDDYLIREGFETAMVNSPDAQVFDPHGALPEAITSKIETEKLTTIGKGNV